MTITLTSPATLPDLRRIWTDAPAFAGLALFLVIGLTPLYAAMALDQRLFQGESPWMKPVKFHYALSIYLISLAFFARYLPPDMRHRLPWRMFTIAVVGAILAEVIWLSSAAMLNAASHFNTDVPLLTMVYPLMGLFAVLLTSASLVMGIAIARNRNTGLDPALRLSIALGLIITFIATVIVAGYLSANNGHFVGTSTQTLPLMGWSRDAGDLRVAHFFATHTLHAIPLAGLAASLMMPAKPATLAVIAASIAYSALILGTFVQALAGQPLI